MKLIFSSLFLVFFSFQMIQSQVIESATDKSSQESYDYHTLKQKKNKTTAWILLGSGVVITMAGVVVKSTDEVLGLIDGETEHRGDWMIYVGSAATIASIPFFISAGKNKRKAKMYLNNSISKINFSQNRNFNCWSVSLIVPL